MHIVEPEDIRRWFAESKRLSHLAKSIGRKRFSGEFLEEQLGLPFHLQFLIEKLSAEKGSPLDDTALDSIPFYSLCRGLFLPLSMLDPQRVATYFGLQCESPPDAAGREKLLTRFLDQEIGLSLEEKLGCIYGDPFLGRRSYMRRDSLLRLLLSIQFRSRTELLDRLSRVGDVAVLYAESRSELKCSPALTAAEVLRSLRFLPDVKTSERFDLLRSLLARCGKLEAYFLAKLVLRKAGFGFDYQGPVVARTLAKKFQVSPEQVAHAMALTDVFRVAHSLLSKGLAGLREIQLQPLVPIYPSLAGGTTNELERFPVWVERKYDGIRLMLHKSTDARGSVLCGAYTRSRGEWLEMISGLDVSIKSLPVNSAIVDGELFGTVFDLEGVRPASVYEVYGSLQGQAARPVNLRFAAFDLIYLNGQDLTGRPLHERRQLLSSLVAPIAVLPLPIPISLAEGQLANSKDDLNRLYQHFRAQGYEGIIAKDLAKPYAIATRDPSWVKRKPEITLDLVLLGATYAVTTKENAGLFGSYVIGARRVDGGFDIVGDVAGVDRVRDAELQQEIIRDGLMTGRRIERPSSSGTRAGIELRPHIVVTVKFEGIIRDQPTGRLSLRDPKIAMFRADKSPFEADLVTSLEEIYLRQRVG